jgi:hypothetical protein
LFQEYEFEFIVKPGKLNAEPDHLSCILSEEDGGIIDDILSNAHLFAVRMVDDYFEDIVQFSSTRMDP